MGRENYRENAEESVKEAYSNLIKAQGVKKGSKSVSPSEHYFKKAINLYEKAGELYLQQAKQSTEQQNFRDVKYALGNALDSYEKAYSSTKRIDNSQRKKIIEQKIELIASKMKSMYPDDFIASPKPQEKFGKLEKKTFSFLAIASFILALFFSVSSLTGFSVANVTTENFRIGGSVFFIVGMVFTFIYLKGKNRF